MSKSGESIYKRKDGRWVSRIMVGRKKDTGTPMYKYFYGHTKEEVLKKRALFSMENPNLIVSESVPTNLEDLSSEWLLSIKNEIKTSTFSNYNFIVQRHILPKLGKQALRDLNTELLNHFLEEEKKCGNLRSSKPLSAKYVLDIRSVLKLILTYGSLEHYMDKLEGRVYNPHYHPKKIEIIPNDSQLKIEKEILKENNSVTVSVLLGLFCGLRIGEVCALKWEDIDFNNYVIHVNKTLYRVSSDGTTAHKTKMQIGTPKTESSLRDVPMTDFVHSQLRKFKTAGDEYVLSGSYKFVQPRTCLNRYHKMLSKAGSEKYTFHALRHTFATRCIEVNVDVKSLSEILGHSDVLITMQRYVHPTFKQKREQLNRIQPISVAL